MLMCLFVSGEDDLSVGPQCRSCTVLLVYSVQCTRRGAGRAALYRTVRGVLVTIGERSGADSVGGAAESESDGTGSVQVL